MEDRHMERHEHTPRPEPVAETQETMAYLGVRLPKAQSGEGRFVPQREKYVDYIEDKFSLGLEKDIAVSFLQGDPILIEGGTSIGKTTTVRKMASDLGYEVHYANLNGATDVEDLMGRYIPNPNRTNAEDPEYIFADGKVTSGLRQEEGKIKVIILDEYNAAAPNILIRLHEVLDALNRGESVVLSEDASEVVPVDRSTTKVVALMNPPGKGYFGKEPLDPAQLRRWVYIIAPTDLPDDSFSYSIDALFTLASQMEPIADEAYLLSRDTALLPEQLQEIPGIESILEKYKEFHKAAKKLVKERKIAADQPQPFTYDDRMEPRRVRDFVLSFYNGDINETFQAALRYYYTNKVDSEVDKAKLKELIQYVEYVAPQNVSARRGADRSATAPVAETRAPIDSDVIRGEIQGWRNVLGTEVDIQPLPASITPEVRRNLERMGMELRFIPSVDLGSLDELKRKGQEQFLTDLQRKYPKWRRYESLSDTEREDHSVTRNLEKWFWELAKEDRMDFPSLPGNWVAVETMPKPSYGEHYAPSKVGEKLGFEDRFNVTWNDANEAIQRQKRDILSEAGLRSGDVRMLNAVEWNLLANREGWGQTNTYELTNTEARGDGGSNRVIVGRSEAGGAARALWYSPEDSDENIGFRVAVVLGS
jgi:MoxR-like ATPase